MHVNTATNCRSTYTVDSSTVLTCNRPLERHSTNLRGQKFHFAWHSGIEWFWHDGEADK